MCTFLKLSLMDPVVTVWRPLRAFVFNPLPLLIQSGNCRHWHFLRANLRGKKEKQTHSTKATSKVLFVSGHETWNKAGSWSGSDIPRGPLYSSLKVFLFSPPSLLFIGQGLVVSCLRALSKATSRRSAPSSPSEVSLDSAAIGLEGAGLGAPPGQSLHHQARTNRTRRLYQKTQENNYILDNRVRSAISAPDQQTLPELPGLLLTCHQYTGWAPRRNRITHLSNCQCPADSICERGPESRNNIFQMKELEILNIPRTLSLQMKIQLLPSYKLRRWLCWPKIEFQTGCILIPWVWKVATEGPGTETSVAVDFPKDKEGIKGQRFEEPWGPWGPESRRRDNARRRSRSRKYSQIQKHRLVHR